MATYYLLGGGFSMMLGAHVRMDVFYGQRSPKRRAVTDDITVFCLIFYLVVLFISGFSSTMYSLEYGQRNYSSWGHLSLPLK
jgi:TRAP-type mannitol/chloroaromatic compound transport system permease small subunit